MSGIEDYNRRVAEMVTTFQTALGIDLGERRFTMVLIRKQPRGFRITKRFSGEIPGNTGDFTWLGEIIRREKMEASYTALAMRITSFTQLIEIPAFEDDGPRGWLSLHQEELLPPGIPAHAVETRWEIVSGARETSQLLWTCFRPGALPNLPIRPDLLLPAPQGLWGTSGARVDQEVWLHRESEEHWLWKRNEHGVKSLQIRPVFSTNSGKVQEKAFPEGHTADVQSASPDCLGEMQTFPQAVYWGATAAAQSCFREAARQWDLRPDREQASQLKSFRQQLTRRAAVAAGVLCLLLTLVGFGIEAWVIHRNRLTVKKYQSILPELRNRDSLLHRWEILEEDLRFLESVSKQPERFAPSLLALSEAVPSGLWFDEITFANDDGDGYRIHLQGKAISPDRVAGFLRDAEKIPALKSGALEKLQALRTITNSGRQPNLPPDAVAFTIDFYGQ